MPRVTRDDPCPATSYFAAQVTHLLVNQRTHYQASERYQKLHFFLGLAIVAIATTVGGFSFADPANLIWWAPDALKLGSLATALLAAIVTFAGFSEWSARHKRTAVEYGRLVREANSRISGVYSEEDNAAYLETFKRDWNVVSANAPITFFKVREKALMRTVVSDDDKSSG